MLSDEDGREETFNNLKEYAHCTFFFFFSFFV